MIAKYNLPTFTFLHVNNVSKFVFKAEVKTLYGHYGVIKFGIFDSLIEYWSNGAWRFRKIMIHEDLWRYGHKIWTEVKLETLNQWRHETTWRGFQYDGTQKSACFRNGIRKNCMYFDGLRKRQYYRTRKFLILTGI